ncbi:orotate phosphoribosyltransferase [Picrophilus oshimae]|uniref:Orotate phosphoribosyltransferase n=1 Tax=Picrophilus torridus (strain ATCC 700027 / DSM 9790 / JCM 10055 / NBRC 100828 / KAW 2/3) TaxID=1122961 RepID=A0A8G2FY18_PICTO|nr:orotate phosphoribosyltransferase [Picrophilus oshimae]SMD31662.1 orotate phosphoribosyltransferase [Picrophilus oshimae DSM 9789]
MLKEDLINSGAIKFGDFVLTSGKRSGYYIDIKSAYTDPEILDEIGLEISGMVKSGKIAGMELGSVPILVSVSIKTKRPFVIIRKDDLKHGTRKRYIGSINLNEEIDIIDDVATTGGSIMKAAEIIRNNGGIVKRAICVVDREEGAAEMLKENNIELYSIIKASELR